MSRLTITQAAKLLAKAGHTFSPKPGPKLEGKTFVTYVTVDGKVVKAADVERLFLKGKSMSLARARQLSHKAKLSLADGDSQLRENIRNILTANQKALSALKSATKLTNDTVNKAARASLDAVENTIVVCQKEISKLG